MMNNPSAILRTENAAILSILEVLEEICFLLRADQEILRMDLVGIADFLEGYCEVFHNGKESLLFYPALEAAGLLEDKPEIYELVAEHDTGKTFIDELKQVTAGSVFNKEDFIVHAEAYIEHMRLHIECEETLLLPLAETELTSAEQANLLLEFEQWELSGIGAKAAADFDRLIQYFQQKYLRNR